MTIMPPSILLIRPQMGENIGAAARAMANFGLSDMRLVAPRDGWPNPKASDMAARALPIIDDAAVYETTHEAVADCQFVLATTARSRAMELPVLDVREAMGELYRRTTRGERCAVMFGPERTGLENEDIMQADAVVTIPVAPEYASLNLAQAVVIVGYEWWMAQKVVSRESFVVSEEKHTPPLSFLTTDDSRLTTPPAPRADLLGLFDQLEAALDDVNFWRVAEKKEAMWRNVRATLLRAGLSSQEVATWRGIIRSLRRSAD